MEQKSKKIAILSTDGFEDAELIYPYYRLKEAGYVVQLITLEKKVIIGKNGYPMTPDMTIEDVDGEITESFHGVVIPGGTNNPDYLRRNKKILDFVKALNTQKKLIAAICHAGWVLISAKVLKGKRATSYYAIRHDMKNAGVIYENSPVVVDENLITSRMPGDLPDFMKAILEFLSK